MPSYYPPWPYGSDPNYHNHAPIPQQHQQYPQREYPQREYPQQQQQPQPQPQYYGAPTYHQPHQPHHGLGHWQQQPVPQWNPENYGHYSGRRPSFSAPVEPEPKPGDWSKKHPNLNMVLCSNETRVRYRVTGKPSVEILTSTYYSHRYTQAFKHPSDFVRLISKSFPWTIEVPQTQGGITCDVIWRAIYGALQEPIQDSEWGLICNHDEKHIEKVKKAYKKRTENVDAGPREARIYKRVDILGDQIWFVGLEKDNAYVEKRTYPGCKPCDDTWVVMMKN